LPRSRAPHWSSHAASWRIALMHGWARVAGIGGVNRLARVIGLSRMRVLHQFLTTIVFFLAVLAVQWFILGGGFMFCTMCGRNNPAEASFCYNCGAALNMPAQLSINGPLFFPVWALILLHYVTFGIFSIMRLNLYHGRIPKRRLDDPSAGKAIGYLFIPFYSLYWIFFVHIRLCERLNEERRCFGLVENGLRSRAIAACIIQVIPFVNYVSYFIFYPIFAGLVQSSFNELHRARTLGMMPSVVPESQPAGGVPM